MEKVYTFLFYNAFPEKNIYYLFGPSITNQTCNTSIISYSNYKYFTISSTTRSLYFTIFDQNGSEIRVSTNALTGLVSTTGNMIGLIPSIDNSQGDVTTTLGDESKACIIYQNAVLNMNTIAIYENYSINSVAIIPNGGNYHHCFFFQY